MSADLDDPNPCLRCGACCAHFRVSFYWAEALANGLADDLTEPVNPWYACMRGTADPTTPRCAALHGTVGRQVACSVYAQRPQACHEVDAGDDKCARARARHGLPALA